MPSRMLAILLAGLAPLAAGAASKRSGTAEILAIMTKSKITYRVDKAPVKHPLPEMDCGRRDALSRRVETPSGTKLVPWEVKPEARPHFDEAESLYRDKKYDEARKEYETALKIDPDYGAGQLFAGDAPFGMGRWEEALADYRKALAIDPSVPQAHRFAADALAHLGRYSEAEAEYIHAIAWDPAYKEAWTALEDLGRTAGFRVEQHPFVVPPHLLGEDDKGAVEIGVLENDPAAGRWLAYTGCRAVWRFEADYRARRLDEKKGTDYSWGSVEESECVTNYVEAALNEIAGKREDDKQPALAFDELVARAPDDVQFLAGVAGNGMFDAYIFFEDLGRRCPRAVAVYPRSVIDSIEAYIRKYVVIPVGPKGDGKAG